MDILEGREFWEIKDIKPEGKKSKCTKTNSNIPATVSQGFQISTPYERVSQAQTLLATFQQKSLILETMKINSMEQPIPNITKTILERIIERDFNENSAAVKIKLKQIESDSESGKNRISAAILKLANGNLKEVEKYITVSKVDFRDVISQAEYPRCSELGFEAMEKPGIEKVYLEDWNEYSEWLNKLT